MTTVVMESNKKSHILESTTTPFEIDVPYKLLESGEPGEKPLILYLHGYNQNITTFQERVRKLTTLPAYHLFIQGPYPIYDRRRKKKVKEWGRAWYLFDGDQDQFIHSMEIASAFIEGVVRQVQSSYPVSCSVLLGYSMGGYLAGYFTLSRPQLIQELVVIGGRIKTEIFNNSDDRYGHLKVLALHGGKDQRVKSTPQKESCRQLSQWGAEVTFKKIDAGHSLSEVYLGEIHNWFRDSGTFES